jgi:glycosyltransferase involved in cell wall biosynthesis
MEAAIEDGQTGIIVRERSPEAFSSAILTLHGLSPEEKAIRAAYMAHRVREQFSLEQQKQAWGVFFNEVSNNH